MLDFAHLHATSDGAFLEREPFAAALEQADAVLEPGAPFHIHFSDIPFANRNETKHLPYGEGTLRAEPLRDALARFERPATVISESPDEALPPGDQGDPDGLAQWQGRLWQFFCCLPPLPPSSSPPFPCFFGICARRADGERRTADCERRTASSTDRRSDTQILPRSRRTL